MLVHVEQTEVLGSRLMYGNGKYVAEFEIKCSKKIKKYQEEYIRLIFNIFKVLIFAYM